MKKLLLICAAVMFCAVIAGYFANGSRAQTDEPGNPSPELPDLSAIAAKIQSRGSARLIVRLNSEFRPEGLLDTADKNRQRLKMRARETEFLNRNAGLDTTQVKKFKYLPFVAIEANAAAFDRIKSDPAVVSIEEDTLSSTRLAESTQLIGAQAAWSQGFSGGGQAVA